MDFGTYSYTEQRKGWGRGSEKRVGERKRKGGRERGERERGRGRGGQPSASSSVMLVVLVGEGGLGGEPTPSCPSPSFSVACVSDLLCGTDSSMTKTVSGCCREPLGGSTEESCCSKGAKEADVGERESGLPSGKGESEMKRERAAAEMRSKTKVSYTQHYRSAVCDKMLWEKVYTTSTHNSNTSVIGEVPSGDAPCRTQRETLPLSTLGTLPPP